METSKNTGTQIAGLLLGTLIGATLGILFAPHKGTKTRARLGIRARFMAKDIKSKFATQSDEINDEVEKIDDFVAEKVNNLTNTKKANKKT